MSQVRIEGMFLGHPIDVTITECDTEDAAPDAPSEVKPNITPPESETPTVGVDTSAAGEVVPGDTTTGQGQEQKTVSADPAPAEAVVDQVPPNPEGNAEQL